MTMQPNALPGGNQLRTSPSEQLFAIRNGSLLLRALYAVGTPAKPSDVVATISKWVDWPQLDTQHEVTSALNAALSEGFLRLLPEGTLTMSTFREMLQHKSNQIVYRALQEIGAPAKIDEVVAYIAQVTQVEAAAFQRIVCATLEKSVMFGFLGKVNHHYYVDYMDLPLANQPLFDYLQSVQELVLQQQQRAAEEAQRRLRFRNQLAARGGRRLTNLQRSIERVKESRFMQRRD